MFSNCYSFNQAEDDVTLMMKNVENVYREFLANMPKEV